MACFHQHLVNQGCRLQLQIFGGCSPAGWFDNFWWFDWEHLELENTGPLGSEGVTESSCKEGNLLWGQCCQHLRLSLRNSTSTHRPLGFWDFIKLLGQRNRSGSPLRELQIPLTCIESQPTHGEIGKHSVHTQILGNTFWAENHSKPDSREALAKTPLWGLFCFGRDFWDI